MGFWVQSELTSSDLLIVLVVGLFLVALGLVFDGLSGTLTWNLRGCVVSFVDSFEIHGEVIWQILGGVVREGGDFCSRWDDEAV